MPTKPVHRKLSAILNADVVGYTRMMIEDDLATIDSLNAFKSMMATLIQKYGGRVVDAPGDNILVDFLSAVEAVECAIAIQNSVKERNKSLPETRAMRFRMGISVGDVIEQDENIYGDGVNIAARLQELAGTGEVFISSSVFNQVKKHSTFGFQSMGKHRLKNFPEPITVYRVVTRKQEKHQSSVSVFGGMDRPRQRILFLFALMVALGVIWMLFPYARPVPESPPPNTTGSFQSKKPSLAVLPFVNLSDDARQEYFCDGLTGNIIASLSKIPDLFIISRHSVFAYKDKAVEPQKISGELGVRYLLEGSVQRAGDKVRVTSQLIDARERIGIWAERYDRDIHDLFEIQDDITMKIVTALRVKLTEGERALVTARGTSNLEAYLKVLEGRGLLWRNDKEGNLLARQTFDAALRLDSRYPSAYRALAGTHINDAWFGWSPSAEESLLLAYVETQKALELDAGLASARGLLGHLYTQMGQHEKAVKECQKAISLDPNDADAYGWMGMALNFAGRPTEAIRQIDKAVQLNPIPPSWYYEHLGTSYRLLQRFDEALDAYRKALGRSPNSLNAHLGLTATHVMAGHTQKGRLQANTLREIHPDFSLEKALKSWPYQNIKERELVLASLREAGLE